MATDKPRGVLFDDSSARRISKVVRRVEGTTRGGSDGLGGMIGSGIDPIYLGKITADVAANASVDVDILAGSVGSEAVPGSGKITLNSHNFTNRKLWSNSYCVLAWPEVLDSGGKWRIIWSDSASRLRGRADVAIAAGASGTVDGLTLLDGRVGPGSSITAYNVLENFDVTDETIVFCEWCQANSRWEIYAADCAP